MREVHGEKWRMKRAPIEAAAAFGAVPPGLAGPAPRIPQTRMLVNPAPKAVLREQRAAHGTPADSGGAAGAAVPLLEAGAEAPADPERADRVTLGELY